MNRDFQQTMELAVADSLTSTPQPFVDGFGERRLVTNARNERFEVLRLTPSLSGNSAFVAAVRDRVHRLGSFNHEAFSRVRSIESDSASGALFVVSDHVRGVRLSTLLAAAAKRSIPFDNSAARALIRQLFRATVSWREQMPELFHGAIAPERIIVTPAGRLILVEHVFGTALERLQYSPERYWAEFHIVVPRPPAAINDAVADIMQVGAVALALLLGRPLEHGEFADGFERTLNASSPRAGGSPDSLSPLRAWLSRALQIEKGHSFVSVLDAKPSLDDTLGEANPGAEQNSIQAFVARCLVLDGGVISTDTAARRSGPAHDDPKPAMADDLAPPLDAFMAQPPPEDGPAPIDLSASEDDPLPMFAPEQPGPVARPNFAGPGPAVARPSSAEPEQEETFNTPTAFPLHPLQQQPEPKAPLYRNFRLPKIAQRRILTTAALAAVVVALAATLLVLRNRSVAPAESTGSLTVVTSPAGATVVLDGSPRGVSPVNVDVTPGDHVVELIAGGVRRTIPVTVQAGGQVSHFVEMAAPQASTGQLLVRTDPPAASVSVDGRLVGQSPVSVDDLAPGSHTVVLKHAAGSVTERVLIEAGKTASLVVPLARAAGNGAGWISVSVPVDVQIFEGGRLLGSSTVDRIMLPAGTHDLEIVQEQLGYRQQRSVRVTAGQVTRIDVAWPNGSVAINAIPWAEVFVDGMSVGETPLGSLQLPIGNHELVFRHPQLGEQRAKVTVTVGQTAKVGIDMRRTK